MKIKKFIENSKGFITSKITGVKKIDKESIDRLYLIYKEFNNSKFKEAATFKYKIDFENKKVTISTNNEKFTLNDKEKEFIGKGKVHSKIVKGETIPLLDIDNSKIRKVFEGIKKCNVEIYKDEIIVTPLIEGITNESENIGKDISNGVISKIVDLSVKKKEIQKYRVPISKLDILMKKVSGNSNIQQLSMFDMGYEVEVENDSINTQDVNISIKSPLNKAVVTTSLLSNFKYFSAFTGSGVFDLAMDQHSSKSIGYSEVDKYAIQNFNANFPNRINFGDITKIDETKLPDFDIFGFGSPCQDLSIMKKFKEGETRGILGKCSKLFFDAARILNHKKPKWFIFENVPNLLKINKGEDWKLLVEKLLTKFYNIKWKVVNTSQYGIPQNRSRLYVVGQRKDLEEVFNYEFPKPIQLTTTAFDYLEPKVDDKYYISEKYLPTILSTGTKGFSAKAETDLDICRPLTSSMAKMHRASQDPYYSTVYKPCDSKNPKTNLRRLTPLECKRLQGVADNEIKNVVSDSQAYKIWGNAMSLNVVRAIVTKLAKYINSNFGVRVHNVQ